EKYDRGLELTKLEKELVILTLTKIDEIDALAEGDVELMEVANELKRLTNDAYTIGLYDEEEKRRRIENSIKNTAKKQRVKQKKKKVYKILLVNNMLKKYLYTQLNNLLIMYNILLLKIFLIWIYQ